MNFRWITACIFLSCVAAHAQQENPIPPSGGALVIQKANHEETLEQPAPQPLPFSPVVEAGGVLYLAGHLGRDPDTQKFAGEIKEETRQTLANIGATLASVNATHADIVRCQVFLASIEDFAAMNDVYRTFFPLNPPARTTVEVSGLALGAKIEIECTAVRGHGASKE